MPKKEKEFPILVSVRVSRTTRSKVRQAARYVQLKRPRMTVARCMREALDQWAELVIRNHRGIRTVLDDQGKVTSE